MDNTTVLVFREGQSGNFLKMLVESPADADITFRIAWGQSYNYLGMVLTHTVDYELHKQSFAQVLRILPTDKIYLATYNNFMKKIVIEEPYLDFKNWQNNLVAWYDKCYYNIRDYYNFIINDIRSNQYKDIINFDNMYDMDYLDRILKQYFNQSLTPDRRQIAKKYIELQLQDNLDRPVSSMQDIIKPITDNMFKTNPWFFSYCVHKYEKNNNLSEINRKWSIDNIKTIQNAHDLLKISTQY